MRFTPRWVCPDCGRSFVQRTREHSCSVVPVGLHLDGKPDAVVATFRALEALLESLGEHRMTAVKTMIILSGVRSFGSITVKKAGIDIGFILDHPAAGQRIRGTQRYGPRKIAHTVRLASPADVDATLAAWLAEAFALGMEPAR